MKKIVLFAFVLLFLVGCGGDSGERAEMTSVTQAAKISESTDQTLAVQPTKRMLIREGFLEFETDDIDATRQKITSASKKYGAYISRNNSFKTSGRINATMSIRVPVDNFEEFLNDATAGVEKFDSKRITAKDVTEEFIDVEARLKAKKELENRYLELLEKAVSVEEMLKIEKEIGKLRADIESLEGRLKYLENRVGFSTIEFSFYEKIPVDNEFGKRLGNGFESGWDNLIVFFIGLTHIWPFILIGVLLIVFLKYLKRRKKKRLNEK